MKRITVLTPTYNRQEYLERLYKSLTMQTSKDFEWLIIDDGSTDNTETVITKFIKEDVIKIKYFKKENGGKHTALNFAYDILNTRLTFIVDSDDYLVPEAIEKIIYYDKKYEEKDLCAFVFQKGKSKTESIAKSFGNKEQIGTYANFIINQNRFSGDKAEVFITEELVKYKFPEFKNEKFVSEACIWAKVCSDKNMLFINEIIYICEYLEGGLTDSKYKLIFENPYAGRYYAEEFIKSKYSLKVRIKSSIRYNAFKILIGKTNKRETNKKYIINYFTILPAYLLVLIWNSNKKHIKGKYENK